MEGEKDWVDVMYEILDQCSELHETLSQPRDYKENKKLIRNYLESSRDVYRNEMLPEFREGLEWFNVSRPLQWQDLKGKIIVLDFFTYCCINCMHVLPYLQKVEERFSVQDGVVVIGVHSGKFMNEKVSSNIVQAMERYEISHPVVNDCRAELWTQFGISCWPTILIIGPDLSPLFVLVGEGPKVHLELYVSASLEFFSDHSLLSPLPLPLSLHDHHHFSSSSSSPLLFPGKVACAEGLLVIADTGHHRLLVCETERGMEGEVQWIVGGPQPGFKDGQLDQARFRGPQGLVVGQGRKIYVADTLNHAIRQIDLAESQVTTIAGTGVQGEDYEGGKSGREQAIASPWDVCLGCAGGASEINALFIAMAGTHQIWAYFLKDVLTWNQKITEKTCMRIAGSGAEENRNNHYPHKAGFAQPSGLATGDKVIYIADSESSSVREFSLITAAVKGVVGGDKNPKNLFAYGDVDGSAGEVRLQHPLGVAWNPGTNLLYVADSYNHKVKVVDMGKKSCTTLVGTGTPGDVSGNSGLHSQLNEPGGLCITENGKTLYVADTNNHCIKVVDLEKNVVRKMELVLREECECVDGRREEVTGREEVKMSPNGGRLIMDMSVEMDAENKLTEEAPQRWKVELPGPEWSADNLQGPFEEHCSVQVKVPPREPGQQETIRAKLNLFFCTSDGTCKMESCVLEAVVLFDDSISSSLDAHVKLSHKIK